MAKRKTTREQIVEMSIVERNGDEREMLDASLRIATSLMCWVKGASFDFEDSRQINRANAEALWKHALSTSNGSLARLNRDC